MSENPPRKRETLPSAWIFGAKLQQKIGIRKKKDKKNVFLSNTKRKSAVQTKFTQR